MVEIDNQTENSVCKQSDRNITKTEETPDRQHADFSPGVSPIDKKIANS